jgi:GNAT superfamily N-acetyltransferase
MGGGKNLGRETTIETGGDLWHPEAGRLTVTEALQAPPALVPDRLFLLSSLGNFLRSMEPQYTIELARPEHLDALAGIERSAATLLAGYVPAAVLEETTSRSALQQAQQDGRLWVALSHDAPVGFALVEMLSDDLPHLQEMDVSPEHGRRGLGTALLRAVTDWVSRSPYREITLTTFRSLPWNMPFYSRFGFEEIPAEELRPELRDVVRQESLRGLDPLQRVVMKWYKKREMP